MTSDRVNDRKAAEALTHCVGETSWEAAALAFAYLKLLDGATDEDAAREAHGRGRMTLKRARELAGRMRKDGFEAALTPRERTGSAENPITKLFPATITEQRFAERLDSLCTSRNTLRYSDDRASGHTLTDFTLQEDERRLPVNIKNAGTRFERALALVGLDPNDSIPIPAYKAYAALEAEPNLLYVVAVDYELIKRLDTELPGILDPSERLAWNLLNRFTGAMVRSAEDAFIFSMVRRHWTALRALAEDVPFRVISARKAIRILQTKPQRTPGIGIRAWGTGASAEVNVHVSIREDMKEWDEIRDRIDGLGLADIIEAVNRKRVEEVYDPEI